jgi:hypothetical protein
VELKACVVVRSPMRQGPSRLEAAEVRFGGPMSYLIAMFEDVMHLRGPESRFDEVPKV